MVRKPSRKQRRRRAAAAAAARGSNDDCGGEVVGADRNSLEVEAIQALARLGAVVRAIELASTSDEGLVAIAKSVGGRTACHGQAGILCSTGFVCREGGGRRTACLN